MPPAKRKIKNNVSLTDNKKNKVDPVTATENSNTINDAGNQKTEMPEVMYNKGPTLKEIAEKYPILINQELIIKFLRVSMTNNQKGRIRQILRDNLKGTTSTLLPDVINSKMQGILRCSSDLTDTDLRKLRILYNMLKTAASVNTTQDGSAKKKNNNKKSKKSDGKSDLTTNDDKVIDEKNDTRNISNVEPEKPVDKSTKDQCSKDKTSKRGPKRYVVFIGNLPLETDKEKIMHHFREISDSIKDVRIPKKEEEKKSMIAYVELSNEPSYEIALSKHHSMLDNKRINVLYSTQKNGKMSKTEAKGKAAKLVALQKSGTLLGSIPLNRKRSQRRKKMKAALAKTAAENQ